MVELGNCARCGAVFAKGIREICPACYYKEEEAFKIVYQFIRKRENREATLSEIVKATGVDEELIIKFIKEKRLQASQFPKLAYPCERCGVDIVTGRLCHNCSSEIMTEYEKYEQLEKQKRALKQKELDDQRSIYYSFDKHKLTEKDKE